MGTRRVEYDYDAEGVKNYHGDTLKSVTNYVGGFVYEGDTPALSFFASPEGRIVKNGSSFEYQYSISDHQGNTRIIFTSATPSPTALTATFEGDGGDQSGSFSNVSNVVSFIGANHTPGGSKVVRMNQGYPVGPAKSTNPSTGSGLVDEEPPAYLNYILFDQQYKVLDLDSCAHLGELCKTESLSAGEIH